MTKRARVQYLSEFFVDITSLLLSVASSLLLFGVLIKRIVHYEKQDWIIYFIVLAFTFIFVFFFFYSPINIEKRSKTAEIKSVVKNNILMFLFFSIFLILTKNPVVDSRYLLISIFSLNILFSCPNRYLLKRYLFVRFNNSKFTTLIGVITTENKVGTFIDKLNSDWTKKIVGITILDAKEENGSYKFHYPKEILKVDEPHKSTTALCEDEETIREISGIPIVANKESYIEWIRQSSLDEVYINIPFENNYVITSVVEELESMGIIVHLNVPTIEIIDDSSIYSNDEIKCEKIADVPMVTFSAKIQNRSSLAIKRFIDIIGGFIGCVLCAIIILFLAIPIKLDSKGPIIFKQERVGRNGRLFTFYKLRSMSKDAEKQKQNLSSDNEMNGLMFKMEDDPRVTRVGKFIRKTSLDEFPQFFNVLKGDMSLVGTRPPTVDEFEKYQSYHKRRLSMRPGITGMWQTSGRSNIIDFEDVVKLDLSYIDNWSLTLDIKLLFKTLAIVFKQDGAK